MMGGRGNGSVATEGREAGQRGRCDVQTRNPGDGPRLTAQEGQVLSLLGDGRTNREIAERLYLSPNTVREYVSRLLEKYGVYNRTELAAKVPGGAIKPPAIISAIASFGHPYICRVYRLRWGR